VERLTKTHGTRCCRGFIALWVIVRFFLSSQSAFAFQGRCNRELSLQDFEQDLAQVHWPIFCGSVLFGLEAATVWEHASEYARSGYAELSGVAYLSRLVSVQTRGELRRILRSGSSFNNQYDYGEIELLSLQVGNKAFNPTRLSLGRLRLPFGVNYGFGGRLIKDLIDDRYFKTPDNSVVIETDNRDQFTLALGFGEHFETLNYASNLDEDSLDASDGKHFVTAWTGRFSYDMAAPEGTKGIVSVYSDNVSRRRYGLALVNRQKSDDQIQIEFVRAFEFSRDNNDFDQLIRVGYKSGFRSGSSWWFQYDQARGLYQIVTIGAEEELQLDRYAESVLARLSISNQRDAGQHKVFDRWFAILGVETRI